MYLLQKIANDLLVLKFTFSKIVQIYSKYNYVFQEYTQKYKIIAKYFIQFLIIGRYEIFLYHLNFLSPIIMATNMVLYLFKMLIPLSEIKHAYYLDHFQISISIPKQWTNIILYLLKEILCLRNIILIEKELGPPLYPLFSEQISPISCQDTIFNISTKQMHFFTSIYV